MIEWLVGVALHRVDRVVHALLKSLGNGPDEIRAGLRVVAEHPDWMEWRGLQHAVLLASFAWWGFHPRAENRRYFPGYFALAFLGVVGAMGFVDYLTKGALEFAWWELLAAVCLGACLAEAARGRSRYHLPVGPGAAWRWAWALPAAAGFWYPVHPAQPWQALALSPVTVWPQPTLLLWIGCIGLALPTVEAWVGWIAGLVGLYLGWQGYHARIGWDAWLVASSAALLAELGWRAWRGMRYHHSSMKKEGA